MLSMAFFVWVTPISNTVIALALPTYVTENVKCTHRFFFLKQKNQAISTFQNDNKTYHQKYTTYWLCKDEILCTSYSPFTLV